MTIDTNALVTASNIGLAGKPSFMLADSRGPDISTASASGQAPTSSAQADMSIGDSRFDTQLSNTLSGLNGDTTHLFPGSNVVDHTNLDFSKVNPLIYQGNGDSYRSSSFPLSMETHGGSLISFLS